MSDLLSDAFASFGRELGACQQVAEAVRAREPGGFSMRKLPKLPAANSRPLNPADPAGIRASLTPAEVLDGWRRGRASWLAGLGRRDLSSVAAALADPPVGRWLSADLEFAASLVPRLRYRQADLALARLYFSQFTPPRHLVQLLKSRHDLPRKQPRPSWWGVAGAGPAAVADHLALRVPADGWSRLSMDLDLPDAACAPSWAAAVVQRARPETFEQAARLLNYADGGRDLTAPNALFEGAVAAVRALVGLADRAPALRVPIATLVRRRVGDVFGPANDTYWVGLEPERQKIRSWVAGEVLDILFKHLVPNTENYHHTEPRREFWKRYTAQVDRLWLLVEHGLRARLNQPAVKELLERVGGLVEIRELEGAGEQAVIWMHLQADNGVVSVVEGNANASCRLRAGAHVPRTKGTIRYGEDIRKGAFHKDVAGVHRHVHVAGWELRLADRLVRLGVRR